MSLGPPERFFCLVRVFGPRASVKLMRAPMNRSIMTGAS